MKSAIAIVGRGRLGTALAAALGACGHPVLGPLGRGPLDQAAAAADIVLLCVPDGAIVAAAAAVPVRPGLLVGHCSGATGLDVLAPHEALALHPLMTVTADGATFAGAGAAVAGGSERALSAARALAEALGMRPFTVADEDRAAYHAAAAVASNFLLALEDAAERLAATAGVPREALVPLVRATVDNWARHGAERALTGPIARGDEAVVARHRAAVAERAPDLAALHDALVRATRAIAARERRQAA
jgi:predicted short-subunit dehydrogenase-like oxidoreductase (DUF2520 family)